MITRTSALIGALALSVLAMASSAKADTLAQWNMTGNAGTETSEPTVALAPGVSNGTITRSGLSANAGGGSFNSTGWSNQSNGRSTGYVTFTLDLGSQAWQLDSFAGASQSSGTGPGTMGLFYVSGGTLVQLGTWTPGNATSAPFNLTLSSAPTLTGVVEFRIYAIGTTAVNGGALGASGTWRLGTSSNTTVTLSAHTVTVAPANDDTAITPATSTVNFGRTMKNAAASQSVALNKTGANVGNFAATVGGSATTSTPTGSISGTTGSVQVGIDTSSTGAKDGTVTVHNTATTSNGAGLGSQDPDNVISASATVLENRQVTVSGTGSSAGTALNLGKVFVGASTGTTSVTLNGGAHDDNNATRVTITGSTSSNGVKAVYTTGADNTFDSTNETKTVNVSGQFDLSGSGFIGTVNVGALLGNGESAGVGATVNTSANVHYTVDVYQRADLSPSNDVSDGVQDSGGTVRVDNNFSDDGGQRAAVKVSSMTVTSGWSVDNSGGLQVGAEVVEGSEASGQISFDATGKLNGTHVGSLVVGFQYADSDIQGAGAATELADRIWHFSHTVTGNVANHGSAGVDAGGSFAGLGLISATAAGTQATLLAGTSSGGTTVTMDFSSINPGASNDAARVSDVVSLAGTSNDVIVLQLSYNPAELAGLSEDDLRLAIFVNGEWTLTGDSFVAGAWTDGMALGTYGIDETTGTVWAVVNQDGQFGVVANPAAIPEPGTYALLALGSVMALVLRRRQAAQS